MQCTKLIFTGHALARMFERAVSPAEIRTVIGAGEIIAEYPQDRPFPSFLVLGHAGKRAIHVVVGRDATTEGCYVITVYEPDPAKWETDLRTRKS